MKPLLIRCDALAADTLELTDESPAGLLREEGKCILRVEQDDEERHISIRLTKETGRELFNWLGVWLHK